MWGSGQFCTPWERMQAANLTMPLSAACTSAWVVLGGFVFGSRCWQALWATWNWGLLARGTTLSLGIVPLLLGSGKLDTPWERMQPEKASAPLSCADPAEVVEEGPPPPHPQTSRARPAVAMITAAVRAVGGDARRGRRVVRVGSFILRSSGVGSWLRPVVDVHRD
jgi:hypothetical protein